MLLSQRQSDLRAGDRPMDGNQPKASQAVSPAAVSLKVWSGNLQYVWVPFYTEIRLRIVTPSVMHEHLNTQIILIVAKAHLDSYGMHRK